MTEYSCTGFNDEGEVYTLLTCAAVTLEQAIGQFREYVGGDFATLAHCTFECIEVDDSKSGI